MATASPFIVCIFIKASLVIGIIHYHPKEYKLVKELSLDKPRKLISSNSLEKPLSVLLPKNYSVPPPDMTGESFSRSQNAVKNKRSLHSGSIRSNNSIPSSKRQRRRVTFLPNPNLKRPEVTTSPDGKHFRAVTISRRHIVVDGHFHRPLSIARSNQNVRNIWKRVSGLTDNQRIPFAEMQIPNPVPGKFRPFPEPKIIHTNSNLRTNGMKSAQRRLWSIFPSNSNLEITGIHPKSELVLINPKFDFSGTNWSPEPEGIIANPEFGVFRPNPEARGIRAKLEASKIEKEIDRITPTVNRRQPNTQLSRNEPNFKRIDNKSVQETEVISNEGLFPQIDWSGPAPWPIQEQRLGFRKMQYPLFPWWQKRVWIPANRSDRKSFLENTERQPVGENAWDVDKTQRRDVDATDSCVALTSKGDCNFYRCFDQKHTCPVEQNFAYNVASYLCRRTENFLNFFEDKAKKYLRAVKRCHMEALVPIYKSELATCAQIEAVGLDILTGGILPASVDDINCFFQNKTFCDVMEDPQNVQLLYDLYGGYGYIEYRVFVHFVRLIQKCSFVAVESFNERYAKRFMTFED